jgi:predicted nuclease of restriction endonuclease-like (RecB) superfamily
MNDAARRPRISCFVLELGHDFLIVVHTYQMS